MLKSITRRLRKNKGRTNEVRQMLTEEEAWEIWKGCGKLAGVDYYEYAVKVIKAYEAKK